MLIANPDLETPNYSIKRVRDDESELPENSKTSYKNIEPQKDLSEAFEKIHKQQSIEPAAVSNVLPETPAPKPIHKKKPQKVYARKMPWWRKLFSWVLPKPKSKSPQKHKGRQRKARGNNYQDRRRKNNNRSRDRNQKQGRPNQSRDNNNRGQTGNKQQHGQQSSDKSDGNSSSGRGPRRRRDQRNTNRQRPNNATNHQENAGKRERNPRDENKQAASNTPNQEISKGNQPKTPLEKTVSSQPNVQAIKIEQKQSNNEVTSVIDKSNSSSFSNKEQQETDQAASPSQEKIPGKSPKKNEN